MPKPEVTFEPVELGGHLREVKGSNGLCYRPVPVSGTKVLDANEGIVEAFVSITGIEDDVQDIIESGAYKKTLAERTPKGVFSHDWDRWVAKTLRAEEVMPGASNLPVEIKALNGGGLLITMQFNLDTQDGREAYSNVKFFGEDCEWSIGYNVPQGGSSYDAKSGVRRIKTLELYEYSPVLFGAMPLTSTLSVKSRVAALDHKTREDVAVERQERIRLHLDQEAKADSPKPSDGHSHSHTHGSGDNAVTHSHDHNHSGDQGYTHTSDANVEHGHAADNTGQGSDTDPDQSKKKWNADSRQQALEDGHAMPPKEDGGPPRFPIADASDVEDAVGLAKVPAERRHIMAQATRVGATEKIPDTWNPDGTKKSLPQVPVSSDPTKAGAASALLELKAGGNADNLIDWYNDGADGQISWGDPGDFDDCVAVASKYMDPEQAKGFCQLRHQDAVGGPPGSEGKAIRLADGTRWVVGEKITSTRRVQMKAKPPDGSYEQRQVAISAAVRDWAVANFDDYDPDTDYCWVESTFPDKIIVNMTMDGEDTYYSVPYTTEDPDNDGDVDSVVLGKPTPVDVSVTITPEDDDDATAQTSGSRIKLAAKAREILGVEVDENGALVKGGRVLSGANATAIKEAVLKLVDVLEKAGVDLSAADPESKAMPMMETKADLAEHMVESHGANTEDLDGANLAAMQAEHASAHAEGSEHEHEGDLMAAKGLDLEAYEAMKAGLGLDLGNDDFEAKVAQYNDLRASLSL